MRSILIIAGIAIGYFIIGFGVYLIAMWLTVVNNEYCCSSYAVNSVDNGLKCIIIWPFWIIGGIAVFAINRFTKIHYKILKFFIKKYGIKEEYDKDILEMIVKNVERRGIQ